MKQENELALIIAFYLSKYDRAGLENLGYDTFNEAYRDIEKKIGVKVTSIKNRRDEFDPIHDNERVGWYQRPMSPSRVRIVEQFSSMSEPTLRGIVLDIINKRGDVSKMLPDVLKKVSERQSKKIRKFVLRGPTGKRAEELFVAEFNSGKTDFEGQLLDCRDLGKGYDFQIDKKIGGHNYIEVKGLDGYTGGVVFTDKEWQTACGEGVDYCLVVVSGIADNPKFSYYKNPANTFVPKRNISATISVSWNISEKQIFKDRR